MRERGGPAAGGRCARLNVQFNAQRSTVNVQSGVLGGYAWLDVERWALNVER